MWHIYTDSKTITLFFGFCHGRVKYINCVNYTTLFHIHMYIPTQHSSSSFSWISVFTWSYWHRTSATLLKTKWLNLKVEQFDFLIIIALDVYDNRDRSLNMFSGYKMYTIVMSYILVHKLMSKYTYIMSPMNVW